MISENVTESDLERAVGAAFGREVAAVEESAEAKMSESEARDIVMGAPFGRHTDDQVKLARAHEVMEAAAAAQVECQTLTSELTGLAESVLGMDPIEASNHARSQYMSAWESSGSFTDAAAALRDRRDKIRESA